MSTFKEQISAAQDRYNQNESQRTSRIKLIKDKRPFQADTPQRVQWWFRRRGLSSSAAELAIRDGKIPTSLTNVLSEKTDEVGLERVMGTADFLGIAFLERGMSVARTVGRVAVMARTGRSSGYGTGFMVSPNLLLTNNHVISDVRTAANSVVEFDYYVRADGGPSSISSFALQPDRFFLTDKTLDYTLIAVAPTSNSGNRVDSYGWNQLIPEEGKAIVGQWVNIIQHPNGEPKQLVLRNNQIVDTPDNFLHYIADTSPGSSGSPVFNDRWEVVALHHSGIPARDSNGRILDISDRVWQPGQGEHRIKWLANEGVRVSRLVAHVEAAGLSADKRAMFREALNMPAPLLTTPLGSEPIRQNSIEGGDMPTFVQQDGMAVWTIPLRVTVQLGSTANPDIQTVGTPGSALQPAVAGAGKLNNEPVLRDERAILQTALRELGSRPDVLEVRLGYRFKNGWITDERAIVVKVRAKRSLHELNRAGSSALPASFAGYPVQVTGPTLADLVGTTAGLFETYRDAGELRTEEITYRNRSDLPLQPIDESMSAILHLSPDAGWPNLETFLKGAKSKLVIGMFDFGAPHILKALKTLKKPSFRELQLTLQRGQSIGGGTKKDDLEDQEVVEQLGKTFGKRFKFGWIKIGSKNGWVASSYHIKVAVRDGKDFWLSSGNWQSSNQPEVDLVGTRSKDYSYLTKYNREWHAIISNKKLAATYESYLRYDLESGSDEEFQEAFAQLPVLQVPEVFKKPAHPEYRYFAPLVIKDKRLNVTPLLTPDNYFDALIKLVKSAKTEILIQNQTFNAPKTSHQHLQDLMEILLEKQRRIPVRIIFRILMQSNARENLEALKDLGFDTNQIRVQTGLHTKGVIIDGRKVLLGSQNISEQGISINRDASLLFDNADIAKYFREVFEHDWNNLAQQDIGSGHEVAFADSDSEKLEPQEGFQLITSKDYLELL